MSKEFTDEEAKELAKGLYADALEKARETEEPIAMPFDDGDPLVERIIEDLSSEDFDDEEDD